MRGLRLMSSAVGGRDMLVKSSFGDWQLCALACPKTVQRSEEIHSSTARDLEEESRVANAVAASLLLGANCKGEERVAVQMNHMSRQIYAEAVPLLGEVRTLVNRYDPSTLPPDFQPTLEVSRILYAHAKPVHSIVPLTDWGEGDLGVFLQRSESNPHVRLRLFNDRPRQFAGGLFLQHLADGGEQGLEEVLAKVEDISLDKLAAERGDMVEVMKQDVLPRLCEGKELEKARKDTRKILVDFFCRCNKDMFLEELKKFDASMIMDMREKKHDKLDCHFCKKQHKITKKDFEDLLESYKNKV